MSTQSYLVQDGNKFHLELRTIDISTYKIERIDVSQYFVNAYRDRAIKSAKFQKSFNQLTLAVKKLCVAFSHAGQTFERCCENIILKLSPITKDNNHA